jgi:hypothetical protein
MTFDNKEELYKIKEHHSAPKLVDIGSHVARGDGRSKHSQPTPWSRMRGEGNPANSHL